MPWRLGAGEKKQKRSGRKSELVLLTKDKMDMPESSGVAQAAGRTKERAVIMRSGAVATVFDR